MGAQAAITVPDVSLQDSWNCSQNSNGTYSAKNISTVSETRTVTVSGIPVGATNIVGSQSVTVGSAFTGENIRRINGRSVSSNTTQTVPIEVTGNGTVQIKFEFRPQGHTVSHTASHTSTLSFTNMVLNVSYTEPKTSFTTNIGTSIDAGSTQKITQDSSSYEHLIWISFGEKEVTALRAPGETSFMYQIPLSWLSEIPDAVSGVGQITVYSRSGGVTIGSQTQAFTLTCPDYVVPVAGSLSATIVDPMWDLAIQKHSSADITQTGATGQYGSSISSIQYYCGTNSGSVISGSWNTGRFMSYGDIQIDAVVTDSRGRKSSTSTTIYVTPYQEPEISSIYIGRCDGKNVGSSTGTGGHILISYGYSAIGSNSVTAKVEHRAKNTSAWLGGTYVSPSATVYAQFADEGSFDSSQSYDIRVTIEDSLGHTAVSVQTLGTAYAFMQWEPQTDAIGFGCHPQGPRRVEISSDWDLYVNGESITDLINKSMSSNIIVSAERPVDPIPGTIWLDIS